MNQTNPQTLEYVNPREFHKKYLQYFLLILAFGIFGVSISQYSTKTDPVHALTQDQKKNIDTIADKRKQEGQILQKIHQMKKELESIQKDIAKLEGENVSISAQIITLTHPTNE